jgi:HlyD family secretion protein
MKANRKSNRKWLWILLGILSLGTVLWLAKSKSQHKGEIVQVAEVIRKDIQELVSASGKIYPSTEVKISSDVSGEIVALYVQEGDSVVKDQLLLKINPDTYVSSVERGNAALNSAKAQKAITEAQLQSAIAQKEQIEAQLINARQIFERNSALFKDQVISKLEYEASEAALKGLEANLRAAEATIKSSRSNIDAASFSIKNAEATLNELKTSLQRTAIYAPTNGIVSRMNVSKGERVVGTIQMTGTELMRIANLDFMEVQVEVTESEILRLAIDQEAEIEVDAYLGKKFSGTVFQIANSATLPAGGMAQNLSADQISNFTVRIRINQDSYSDLSASNPRPFRPGMSASVSIKTAISKNALAVPVQAVTVRDNRQNLQNEKVDKSVLEEKWEVVFSLEANKAHMKRVKTGLQDEGYIEILDGLIEGEKIITGSFALVSKKLEDQMIVRHEEEQK